jgi:hypothetical protein
MRRILLLGLAAILLPAEEPPLRGYSKEAARLERQWEAPGMTSVRCTV